MLPIVLADNNAEYTGRKQALPAIIHLATIISLQYLLCDVMQFCIQTTKSCEEEEHRTLAGGGTESGEEESAERSLVLVQSRLQLEKVHLKVRNHREALSHLRHY